MGIKRKDKSKLFKLFGFVQTTEDVNTRGIGLGLVISKKIVEHLGGFIGFKSKWMKGSNFGFCICLDKELEDTDLNQDKTNAMIPQMTEEQFEDTENENQEQDLDMLIFGNPEMPSSVT